MFGNRAKAKKGKHYPLVAKLIKLKNFLVMWILWKYWKKSTRLLNPTKDQSLKI